MAWTRSRPGQARPLPMRPAASGDMRGPPRAPRERAGAAARLHAQILRSCWPHSTNPNPAEDANLWLTKGVRADGSNDAVSDRNPRRCWIPWWRRLCGCGRSGLKPSQRGSPHVQTSQCIFVTSKGRNQTRYRVFTMRKGGYGGSHDDDAGAERGSVPDVLPHLGGVALSQRRRPALARPRSSFPPKRLLASLTRYFGTVGVLTPATHRQTAYGWE